MRFQIAYQTSTGLRGETDCTGIPELEIALAGIQLDGSKVLYVVRLDEDWETFVEVVPRGKWTVN